VELPSQGDLLSLLAARGGAAYSAPLSWWESEASAAFVAAVLTDGFNPALAGELSDRVTEYLGREQKRRLHKRDQASVDCTLLAEAARRSSPSNTRPTRRLAKQQASCLIAW
jgi:hypothetical protein